MTSGVFVDLTRKHLARMVHLRQITQRAHAGRQPELFQPEIGEREAAAEIMPHFGPRWFWQHRNMFALGWEEDGLAGYALYYFSYLGESAGMIPRNVCFVSDIAVAEDRRGQGVGRRLLEEVARRARAAEMEDLLANVWHGNHASHAMFAAAGFETERVMYRLPLGDGQEA